MTTTAVVEEALTLFRFSEITFDRFKFSSGQFSTSSAFATLAGKNFTDEQKTTPRLASLIDWGCEFLVLQSFFNDLTLTEWVQLQVF